MKKNLLSALLTLSLLGPWGCSKVYMPMSPNSSSSSTVPTPKFAAAWTKAGSTPLSNPQGIAADGNGNVYVVDTNADEVFKFDSNGNLKAQWGNMGNITLDLPSGAAVYNGNLYVADSGNERVVEYDSNGNVLAVLSPTGSNGGLLFAYPTGVSFDQQGNLYVADNSNAVYEFNSSLRLTAQWGTGSTQGIFSYPVVSVEDKSGNIYVANYNGNDIIKVNAQQSTVSSWGQSGSQTGDFASPSDVKMDSNGNVYVVDTGNNRVQVFNSNGTYLTLWGQGSNASENLNQPSNITLDGNGNAYVADTGNARVVKYSLN